MGTVTRIFSYVRRYWLLELLILICMGSVVILNLAIPMLVRMTIDRVLVQMDYKLLLIISLSIVGITALRGTLAYAQRYTMEYVAQRVVYDIRNHIYNALERQSFAFYDRIQTGQLMSRVTSDVDLIRGFLAWSLPTFISTMVTFAGILIITLSMSWKLTLFSLVTAPIVFLVAYRFSRSVRPIYYEAQQRLGTINSVLQENLTGVRVVRAFAKEELEEEKFRIKNKSYFDCNITATRLRAKYIPFMDLITGIGMVIILLYGGLQVVSGEITIGTLVAFNSYLTLLIMPMRFLGFITSFMERALAGGKRIFEILDAVPEVKDKPDAIEMPPINGYVRFDNVSFSYGQSPAILKNVIFEAKPGETIALLGTTGSGKSSIINLIARFYDVTDGRVTIDGYDVRDVKINSLRKQIGIVPQETFLFSTTIRENIAYGKPSASMDDIVNAAKVAEAHDFIVSFPQGYDTVVGERGVTLSGGQRQRVAIARALLMDPKILILDDSTSSVDIETEYEIQRALQALLRNRTTFVITQRLSTIKSAHKIIVLDAGQIVEMGTHEELMRNNGLYKRIYDTQLAAQIKPEEPRLSSEESSGKGLEG